MIFTSDGGGVTKEEPEINIQSGEFLLGFLFSTSHGNNNYSQGRRYQKRC